MKYKEEILSAAALLCLTILSQNPFQQYTFRENYNPENNVMNSYLVKIKYVVEVERFDGSIDTVFPIYTHVPTNRDITLYKTEHTFCYPVDVPNFCLSSEKYDTSRFVYGVKRVTTLGIYNPL